VTAILRLVLDQQGHLLHGEVVEIEDKSSQRFKDWADLSLILRNWWDRHTQASPPKPP
jgi:hypothetical protein